MWTKGDIRKLESTLKKNQGKRHIAFAEALPSCKTAKSARVIQVIETVSLRGAGVEGNEIREVRQYWDFEGLFLAEYDPAVPGENPGR